MVWRAFSTSAALARSTFRTDTPSAREKPVPLTVQSFLSKALTTWRPSRPVAPVTRTVFADIADFKRVGPWVPETKRGRSNEGQCFREVRGSKAPAADPCRYEVMRAGPSTQSLVSGPKPHTATSLLTSCETTAGLPTCVITTGCSYTYGLVSECCIVTIHHCHWVALACCAVLANTTRKSDASKSLTAGKPRLASSAGRREENGSLATATKHSMYSPRMLKGIVYRTRRSTLSLSLKAYLEAEHHKHCCPTLELNPFSSYFLGQVIGRDRSFYASVIWGIPRIYAMNFVLPAQSKITTNQNKNANLVSHVTEQQSAPKQ